LFLLISNQDISLTSTNGDVSPDHTL